MKTTGTRSDDVAAVITGLGTCLPDHILGNDDVIAAGELMTTDEWIRSRTGIRRRRRVVPGTSTGDLAVAAGRAALDSGGDTRPDLLILATSTPDHRCPATAPDVAHRLELGTIAAFDLSAVCSGFLYALITAAGLIRSGVCTAPLVIGADTYSAIINPRDRDTAAIFGDGAGAVLLQAGTPESPGAILATDWGSDGSGSPLIGITGGGSRHPDSPGRYFQMHGREVYAHAVRRMTHSAYAVLDKAGWPAETVGAFIGHQANQRILDAVAERLTIDAPHCFGNIGEVGNTAAASIPLALAETAGSGLVAPGERTLLTAFGGGLTWASAALTWPAVTPRAHPGHSIPAPAHT
ncbi:3-oxoacyl-[acyl-carrier-protein] synthase-3 [Allocatelliglobosispora scoriae]|uniref:Beta-ketoacyl-[acyl-carrier-protein] synthase III n=1 Tax=Allocatelliglobosispora scoriae TaxID=643052 RepID=A0A841BF51_9ACTN|nr:beta-ketoacyl-ACP synthase 3 [Allocatelliglobosispora scoriae]MBB5866924.1 3-oxoacyl-[acyl-carrier-protein] synthase-3 [Allocatelliglobosispora scoriae]